MEILLDVSVEEMAQRGYVPVMDAALLTRSKLPGPEGYEGLADRLLEIQAEKYPFPDLLQAVEYITIKTDFVDKPLRRQAAISEEDQEPPAYSHYPVLFYAHKSMVEDLRKDGYELIAAIRIEEVDYDPNEPFIDS
ncbi:hypothetical protein GF351_01955 [Candidatus Woesearchaeota archaeon]|nr:hypothetical protein [Candidatus Woesearchaeota archaeon]